MTEPKTQTERAKACPFCGGDMKFCFELRDGYEAYPTDSDAFAYFYRCTSCAATSGWSKCESGALRQVNMRTEVEAATRGLREQLEAAEAVIRHYASHALFGHVYAGDRDSRNPAQEYLAQEYLKKHGGE